MQRKVVNDEKKVYFTHVGGDIDFWNVFLFNEKK